MNVKAILLLSLLVPSLAAADMHTIKVLSTKGVHLDENLKPTTKPIKKVKLANGTQGCNLDKPAGTKKYAVWFVGTIAEGKFHATGSDRGGAAKDIVNCAYGVMINSRFDDEPGDYKVIAIVQFKKGMVAPIIRR